jgi:hypothetical protein
MSYIAQGRQPGTRTQDHALIKVHKTSLELWSCLALQRALRGAKCVLARGVVTDVSQGLWHCTGIVPILCFFNTYSSKRGGKRGLVVWEGIEKAKTRSLFARELAKRQAQLASAWPCRRIALRSRGGLHPFPSGLDLVLGVRPTLLIPPGASRGVNGDGVNKVPHNTSAPQSRVGWSHG